MEIRSLFFLFLLTQNFRLMQTNFRTYAPIVREVNNYSLHISIYICVYNRQTRIDNITLILIERVV